MRTKLLTVPCLALSTLLACSATPDAEKTENTSSALDPNQVFNPTYYTVTLSKMVVNRAVEPWQAGNMVNYGEEVTQNAGIPSSEPANASISRTPGGGQCGGFNTMVWSPDTGFVDAAQLGVKVTPTIPGPAPWNTGNPMSTACTFNAASGTLQGSYCQSSAFNTTFTNGQLTLTFSVNPGDQVALAMALDNIEAATVTSTSSQMDNSVSTDIKNFGDSAALYGGLLSSTGAPEVGGAIALIGAAATVAGDLVAVDGTNSCSANQLAVLASSCAGGLAGPPQNPACSSGWPNASTALEGCSFGAPQPDLLRIVDPTAKDPSTGKPIDLTAERLQELTAAGPVTFEFNPKYDFTNPNPSGTTTWYHVPRGSETAPGIMAGCASDVTIDVTVARQWFEGAGSPAAFAKSGDMAVVRAPGTIDTFASSPSSYENQLVHDWGQGTGFSSEVEAPATSTEEAGVSLSTLPAVVSRTESNLDMFYVDGSGGLYTVFQAAPSYTWSVEQLAAPTWCPTPIRLDAPKGASKSTDFTSECRYAIAPPNAYVSAAARSPDNLDVFFIGSDGNVYTTYWSSTMGTNAQGLPNWGVPFAITTQSCAKTNAACAGSASPGGGIATVSRDSGELDVFWVGKDGGIWTAYWDEGNPWVTMEVAGPSSQWQPSAAIAPAGAVITATARTSVNLDVFTIGYDTGVWTTSWSAASGRYATSEIPGTFETGMSGGPISAVSRQPGALDVVYQGTGSTLQWAKWATPATSWSVASIPAAAGMSTGMLGRGGVSVVAPTSFSLQAFYLNGLHQENTVTWADFNECNTVSGTPCTPSTSSWTGEVTLPQP